MQNMIFEIILGSVFSVAWGLLFYLLKRIERDISSLKYSYLELEKDIIALKKTEVTASRFREVENTLISLTTNRLTEENFRKIIKESIKVALLEFENKTLKTQGGKYVKMVNENFFQDEQKGLGGSYYNDS